MRRSYRGSSVIRYFGQWVVTKFGLECSIDYYAISKKKLRETDWSAHMAEKGWVDMSSFNRAYRFALQYHLGQ